MAETPLPPGLTRRNLPRASQACERCRLKKAKCDQRQPCSNCTKHAQECTYGVRRRNIRPKNGRISTSSAAQPGLSSPGPSAWDGQDEPSQREEIERTPCSDRSSVDNADVVGEVNQHTHGTEFYGTASNFVLLNQFFHYARKHHPPSQRGSVDNGGTPHLSPASAGPATGTAAVGGFAARSPLSIVNILSNEDVLEPPSRPKTPVTIEAEAIGGPRVGTLEGDRPRSHGPPGPSQAEAGYTSGQTRATGNGRNSSSLLQPGQRAMSAPDTPLRIVQQRLEREYVRQFMDNLHHLHPLLDPVGFTARCEEQIWNAKSSPEKKKSQQHFFALYNIVVAVGALVSGSSLAQRFEQDIQLCMKHSSHGRNSSVPLSSQELSKTYFRKARAMLQNVFEVCSLESSQALLLMSLYCQNSLKPHACYMYCGHAVRTALAIGIERESPVKSVQDRKAARRTWWCIYSHEIDMSCSAGRRDSLGKPHNYKIDLPHVRDRDRDRAGGDQSHLEPQSVAMINEMVYFGAILRRISKELYYDTKGLNLAQKSAVAKRLDILLDDWKDRLPAYLNFEHASFREAEWASKQKLVLQLRYLNARIVLHRPFLEAHIRKPEAEVSSHVGRLLEAARDTIRVMYTAYASRHYFRTWWYNATYTLYAGMIVLYIIMLDLSAIPLEELMDDVNKAQEILESMEEAVVARRSANLIREGLEVARACVESRRSQSLHAGAHDGGGAGRFDLNDISGQLSYAGIGQDPALFASIVDPNLLQDFMAADGDMLGLEFSMPSLHGFGGSDVDPNPDLSFF